MKMKIGLALILAAASLQAQKATAQPENQFAVHAELFAWPTNAANVTVAKAFTHAAYKNSQTLIYKTGGASVVTAKIPQTEIAGETVEVEGGALLCADPLTGDYLKLNPYTGVSEAKIAGQYFVLLPRDFGTPFAIR